MGLVGNLMPRTKPWYSLDEDAASWGSNSPYPPNLMTSVRPPSGLGGGGGCELLIHGRRPFIWKGVLAETNPRLGPPTLEAVVRWGVAAITSGLRRYASTCHAASRARSQMTGGGFIYPTVFAPELKPPKSPPTYFRKIKYSWLLA